VLLPGGLYASCSYSQDKPADYGLAKLEDFCSGNRNEFPAWWEFDTPGGTGNDDGSNHEDNQFGGYFRNYMMFLLTRSVKLLGSTCSGTSIADNVWNVANVVTGGGGNDGPRRKLLASDSDSDGKASVADYYQHYEHRHEPVTYYPGIALMISGPMSISSKKDGKFETTGMFEQSILFHSSAATKAEATNYWPMVRARGTKLRFTRTRDQYYEAGSQ
jgi:hypothetical protein